jgi:hypothetical protein
VAFLSEWGNMDSDDFLDDLKSDIETLGAIEKLYHEEAEVLRAIKALEKEALEALDELYDPISD